MADLLPSSPDLSAAEESDPRVVGVDSDDADDLIGALSSETARSLLAALHDEPANPAKLAEEVDTTIQNAQYHLGKLEEAGLIEVVDTVYSEKGREMQVYAPSDRPLVVVAAREEETTGLRAAISRLLGALGALGLSSLLVEQLVGEGLVSFGASSGSADGAGGADGAAPTETVGADVAISDTTTTEAATETAEATPTATPEAMSTPTATDGAAGTGTPTPAPTGEPTPTPAATGTPSPQPTATEAATQTPTRTPVELVEQTTTEALGVADAGLGLPPGLLFFAGGATVLLAGFALWYLRG